MKSLLDLFYDLGNFVHEKRIIELIKSFIPGVGFKYYKEARTDSLTKYPNRRALIEDLNYLNHKSNGPVAIFYYDILGLKRANDAYGYEYGDTLVLLGLMILEKAISDQGLKGKVYREYGDEGAAIVRNINKEVAEQISKRVDLYYKLINIKTESALGQKYSVSLPENNPISLWVDRVVKEYKLPKGLLFGASIGYSLSPEGKNLYSCLDKSRKMCKLHKDKLYRQHSKLKR